MFSKSQKSSKGFILPLLLILFLCAIAVWGISRGSFFFSKQLQTQPSDSNLIRLWNLQDYDGILSLSSNKLNTSPMDLSSLVFTGFASYHKAISQISLEDEGYYLDLAIRNLRKALIHDYIPQKELVFYILGKSYLYKGPYYADLAVEYLTKALDAGYINQDSYEFIGEAYSYLGDYDKSIHFYETALEKFQSDRLYLKIAEDSFKFGRYNKAAQYYTILIEHTKDESLKKKGLFHLGKLYYDIKNLQRAEETLLNLVDLNPADAEAFFILGEIHFFRDEVKEARSYWHKTLRIDPEHRNARLRLYN